MATTKKLQTIAQVLLILNFCMYAIVLGIGGWTVNRAINHGFIIGKGPDFPPHFSPLYFPMGNAATGFFVVFALIAAAVGLASSLSGFDHINHGGSQSLRAAVAVNHGGSQSLPAAVAVNHGGSQSLPAAVAIGTLAWTLTILAMGFAWKEIDLGHRNGRLITMEAFIIILSATQLFYVAAIHGDAGAHK